MHFGDTALPILCVGLMDRVALLHGLPRVLRFSPVNKPTCYCVYQQDFTPNIPVFCVFCLYLRTNSDYFHMQHYLIDFITVTESVYCSVRTETLYKIRAKFSVSVSYTPSSRHYSNQKDKRANKINFVTSGFLMNEYN
jgi:hypothetical protein